MMDTVKPFVAEATYNTLLSGYILAKNHQL